MIADSSALVAIMLDEPDRDWLVRRMADADLLGVGAPTLAETGIVLSARLGPPARSLLARLAEELDLGVVPFGEEHARIAVQAWNRFGKGRHPAQLNLGDCMSYATARIAGQPLLCVGDDFPRTDLPLVPRYD